jgi:CRP-like cAMP-binding protein
MRSTLEKVLVLKTVSIFAETADVVLLELAAIVKEEHVAAGAQVFAKGDLGTSMFLIAAGRVRVHDGEHTLNELGPRDVFGEMALLDPEPRLASVTALEPTQLLRIDHGPFYEVMADRIEVARGIIKVLTGYLRARVRDLAELHARVRELEGERVA